MADYFPDSFGGGGLMDPGGGGILGGGAGGPNPLAGGDFFGNNPALLGGLAGAAGLGYAAFKGGGDLPYAPQMQGTITNLGGVAQTAQAGYNDLYGAGRGYTQQGVDILTSGNLPPGAEQYITNMVKAQDTATKGRYASLGLSGSTMEGDALASVQNQATAQRFQISQQMGQQLATIGSQAVQQAIAELGISEKAFGDQANIYGKLMEAQMKADKNTSDMIGKFAGALGGAFGMMVGGPPGAMMGSMAGTAIGGAM